ncbi:MAG: hypothetical protein P0Y53_25115 [Candidatus Pseudobacter hemicellulosilyticus]|uniref:Uncharacterized protein n=1 Tax=Candidatus Pseudobacter hemicellulosilyticus TaxID=3121375 RepID=A0AAJ6BFL1_9BACT|nr:MAG: hypothetical protein P0Y53_25115 [Pseudobacter sp.]
MTRFPVFSPLWILLLLLLPGATVQEMPVRQLKLSAGFHIDGLHRGGQNGFEEILIYGYGDCIAYALPVSYLAGHDSSLMLRADSYNYLVHRKGQQTGWYYPSFDSRRRRVKVAAVLEDRAIKNINMVVYFEPSDTLIQQEDSVRGYELLHRYWRKEKPDEYYNDFMDLYFSGKLAGYDFYSLGPSIERVVGRRIAKAVLTYKPYHSPANKGFVAEKMFWMELRPVPELFPAGIDGFVRKAAGQLPRPETLSIK